ncbi:oxidoreductase [Shewanella sp. c952]|uniref:SDR family NAD(P)-dependent oxidoreductase n=1 Tax=Shewanella sp. c952 TaxID=2815913 RepID=UPI001BC063C1|nr:SDR family NAD(P)-dependent oxidoreductase [Shewanella sp. c952]GIU04846.1 oxidoreductase [Shewanella sp. c952]
MTKTILITGATDGIGLETAKVLVSQGHHVLLHGRSETKLAAVTEQLASGSTESYIADLSVMSDVTALADNIKQRHQHIDVIINNAGVYGGSGTLTKDGFDLRFAVNTFAPYLLTQKLLPLLGKHSRVVNLSSAAQASIDLKALAGEKVLPDGQAYAQSKLAITMWSRALGLELQATGPIIVSVNPASMLGSKMVKDAFGVTGGDLSIGVDILCRAALSDEFSAAAGLYFDNDIGRFSSPHNDALDDTKVMLLMDTMKQALSKVS